MKDNVIDLNAYRARRGQRTSLPLTADQAYEIALASHLVCAETGHELAGVAMPQLVKSVPAGEAFWGRVDGGVWFWVDPEPRNLAWMRDRGWELKRVRLVPDAKRGSR